MPTETNIFGDATLKSDPTQNNELTPSRLEGAPSTEILANTSEAEWGRRGDSIINEAVESAEGLCEPTDASLVKLQTHLQEREKGFVDSTGKVDTAKVSEYVEDIYGKDKDGKSIEERIDTAVASSELVTELVDFPTGTRKSTARTFIKDSILLAIATGTPREVNTLLKGLEKGTIALKTTKGDSVSTPAKLLLKSMHSLANNQYADPTNGNIQFSLHNEAKGYVENPTDRTKKTAFVGTISKNVCKVSNAPVISKEWIVTLSGQNKSTADKMFKGVFGNTGMLKKVSKGVQSTLKEELSTFNKTPMDKLGSQLRVISEISTIARDTTKGKNQKVSEIESKLNERKTKSSLGEIFETIDANISIENPRHKEVLARRGIEKLNLLAGKPDASGRIVELTKLSTPWNTTWGDEFRKATESLNEEGDVMAAADLLGRVAIFGPLSLRKEAKQQLEALLTSVLINQGESKDAVLKLLKEKDPTTYGSELKKLFTGTNTGELGSNPENSSARLASLIFNRLASIEYFGKIKRKGAGATEEEKGKLDILINRLHNSDGSVFDISMEVDPATYSDAKLESTGDTLQEKLQAEAVAEALGMDVNDPQVKEIMKMSDPGNLLQFESRKLARINQSENIRKASLAGIAALGVALTFNPATSPVGTVILATTAAVKVGVALKNIIDSTKRIGFKKTMSNMWSGMKKSFTFIFEKERTGTEKLVYGAAFLGGVGRMFLPGVGSVLYASAETAAALISEKKLSSKRKMVALEVAALRTLMDNTKLKTSADREVKVTDVWKDYITRREAVMAQVRQQALQSGENEPPLTPYSDREVLEYIKEKAVGKKSDNEEADFLEVMDLIVTKQETIKELNESYNKAAGLWGAAFAGTMVGTLFGGVARIGAEIASNNMAATGVESTQQPEALPADQSAQQPPVLNEEVPIPAAEPLPEAPLAGAQPTTNVLEQAEVTTRISFDEYPLLKEGLVARGMNPSVSHLVVDPDFAVGGWADFQRQAVNLIQEQGLDLNSKVAGYAVGELAAQGIYNGATINADTLQAAIEKAASLGIQD